MRQMTTDEQAAFELEHKNQISNRVEIDYTAFNTACEQFRMVCMQIRQFTGIQDFRGGFNEFTSLLNSPAFQSNPVQGNTLALLWSGANEYCIYEGSKVGLGQPDWWYKCWESELQQ